MRTAREVVADIEARDHERNEADAHLLEAVLHLYDAECKNRQDDDHAYQQEARMAHDDYEDRLARERDTRW